MQAATARTEEHIPTCQEEEIGELHIEVFSKGKNEPERCTAEFHSSKSS
jgi:hypothetical protein